MIHYARLCQIRRPSSGARWNISLSPSGGERGGTGWEKSEIHPRRRDLFNSPPETKRNETPWGGRTSIMGTKKGRGASRAPGWQSAAEEATRYRIDLGRHRVNGSLGMATTSSMMGSGTGGGFPRPINTETVNSRLCVSADRFWKNTPRLGISKN